MAMEQSPAEVAPLNPEGNNLPAALLAGSVAAAVGAVAWSVIAVMTGLRIGWVAVGIGFLVGYAVRVFGKGSEPMFQVLGAVLSLLGCLAGNLLMVCVFLGRQQQIPLLTVLTHLNPSMIVDLMVETFRAMDLVFYGIAIYEGYRFSLAPVAAAAPRPGLSV
jgi:hypothetical protein